MNVLSLRLFVLALLLSSSVTNYAQYCTAVGPSVTTWSNVESATISGESGTSISYTGCPGIIGLEDLTSSQSVSLNAGGNYTLNVQFGTCDNNWPGAGEAWIDFNGNFLFDPSESIGTWQGTPPVAMSVFNFTVPANCVNGSLRMRIAQIEDVTPPLNPCSSFTYGSMVDFEVILSGGSGGTVISYCTGVGPSQTADSNLETLYIAGEGGTSISFSGCPGVVGLQDMTSSLTVDLGKNISYDLDLVFGTCGGNYSGAGEVWIDYNQNGVFEPSESIGTWQGIPPGGANTFNFTVPGAAVDGPTRMRVVHQEGAGLPLNPCANFTWGSTTDFEVVIGVGQDCSGYVGDNMLDPRIVSTLPYTENYDNSVCYSNNVTVYNSPDVFYRLIPADYGVGSLNVSLCGSSFDTYLQILNTDSSVIAFNDDYGPCAPQSELKFSTAGYDTVFAVVQGWNNLKGPYTITINDGDVVGFEEDAISYKIYPNPSKDFIIIEGINDLTSINIRDLKGAIVQSLIVNSNSQIDIQTLSSGTYLVELINDLGYYQSKLIVQP